MPLAERLSRSSRSREITDRGLGDGVVGAARCHHVPCQAGALVTLRERGRPGNVTGMHEPAPSPLHTEHVGLLIIGWGKGGKSLAGQSAGRTGVGTKRWVEVLGQSIDEWPGRTPRGIKPTGYHQASDPLDPGGLQRSRCGLKVTARGPGVVEEEHVAGRYWRNAEVVGVELAGTIVG